MIIRVAPSGYGGVLQSISGCNIECLRSSVGAAIYRCTRHICGDVLIGICSLASLCMFPFSIYTMSAASFIDLGVDLSRLQCREIERSDVNPIDR